MSELFAFDCKMHKEIAERAIEETDNLSVRDASLLGIIRDACTYGLCLEAENADLRNELKAALERC